ncbi:class I SAM-dependent methyltransferase [Brevibacterium luteolum]|uniref:Class I SAM-dependent methyltransferase n=2 Tax=Brevibacterium luteolum TaxID=199591 RepID=A0A2N6PFJ6_9MICO|nr:class I SAM-dependent methyltransferase [Brevibacterium luteolum]
MPGTALDLGCGEGADVLWLAHRGWRAVGVDIAQGAIIRARATAEASTLEEGRAQFLRTDLGVLAQDPRPEELVDPFDLVTASYLQSPVALDRQHILRAAAALVAPGGHLLLTLHAAAPSWAADEFQAQHDHDHHGPADFPSPQDELTMLSIDPQEWETLRAEVVTCTTTAPDGSPGQLDDTIVLLRRRGIPAAGMR